MDYFEQMVIENADSRVTDWPLLGRSPLHVWIITAVYLFFVLWLGPLFMRDRKPFKLKQIMFAYNVALVVLSVYMTVEIFATSVAAGYSWSCGEYNNSSRDPNNQSELRIAKVLWWYYASKAVEYLDTVFMVLRKKQQQVTFLHVFHHVSMLNIWWFVMSFTPGGNSYFGPMLNSAVHSVMYGYYALAVFPGLRPYLWWKKYITQLQLIQFVIVLTQTLLVFFNGCDYPNWGKYVLSSYMLILLILFTNFYVKTYRSAKQQKGLKNQ